MMAVSLRYLTKSVALGANYVKVVNLDPHCLLYFAILNHLGMTHECNGRMDTQILS